MHLPGVTGRAVRTMDALRAESFHCVQEVPFFNEFQATRIKAGLSLMDSLSTFHSTAFQHVIRAWPKSARQSGTPFKLGQRLALHAKVMQRMDEYMTITGDPERDLIAVTKLVPRKTRQHEGAQDDVQGRKTPTAHVHAQDDVQGHARTAHAHSECQAQSCLATASSHTFFSQRTRRYTKRVLASHLSYRLDSRRYTCQRLQFDRLVLPRAIAGHVKLSTSHAFAKHGQTSSGL